MTKSNYFLKHACIIMLNILYLLVMYLSCEYIFKLHEELGIVFNLFFMISCAGYFYLKKCPLAIIVYWLFSKRKYNFFDYWRKSYGNKYMTAYFIYCPAVYALGCTLLFILIK